jgi:hypothetical protein
MHTTYEAAKDFFAVIGLLCMTGTLIVLVLAAISYFRAE